MRWATQDPGSADSPEEDPEVPSITIPALRSRKCFGGILMSSKKDVKEVGEPLELDVKKDALKIR